MKGRVLIVAGSDSGGGAGIQADIKSVTALNGYAMTAITALTAQDTRGVHGIVGVEPAFIAQQMEVVLADLGADAIKTGMLHSAEVIETVAATLAARAPDVPLVVDPVMVAKGGHRLLQEAAERTLVAHLLPRATLLTPNLPEAEVLVGFPVASEADMTRAGKVALDLGAKAVLVKGGHLESGVDVVDLLVTPEGVTRFAHRRIASRSTHGTGCPLIDAVARARDYVRRAIESAPGFGQGHGPLDHAVTLDPAWRA
jgi:hydroxymethylpyrimidine/phosphomethylpyrimidine kinase